MEGSENIKLGLLTVNSLYRSEAKLVSAGIDLYFRDPHGDLVGFFDNQATQRPDLITIAKTQCNVAPQDMIIIDDSLIGAEMAKKRQIQSVLVANW